MARRRSKYGKKDLLLPHLSPLLRPNERMLEIAIGHIFTIATLSACLISGNILGTLVTISILILSLYSIPLTIVWDLAFHCVAFAVIDQEFAKNQLLLFLREWYMHPNGALPAYEFGFSDGIPNPSSYHS